MEINNEIAKKLKEDFPIFKNNKGLIYLDNAATSQRPKRVIDSLVNFYEKDNANAGRGIHTLAEKAMENYSKARENIAKFVSADIKEIIFTRNTTESLNLLAYTMESIIPQGKDEILLTEMEHHSNLVPWQQLAKKKDFKLKFIKVKDFKLDLDDFKEKLNEKTAIVSFVHISNVLGTVNPAKEIVNLAKSKGAITIIDASQSVQHTKVNVKEIDCDFLVFSGHKMLGPSGIGVLYGREELLEQLSPFNFGGGMIRKVDFENSIFADPPEKFEAGTQNIAEAVALSESVKYLEELGLDNIKMWESKLVDYCLKKLKEIQGINTYSSGQGSLISFNLEGVHPHDIAELLNEDKIAIRAGHQCTMPLMKILGAKGGVCRVSFSIYNTFEDIDKLAESLKKIKEKFR